RAPAAVLRRRVRLHADRRGALRRQRLPFGRGAARRRAERSGHAQGARDPPRRRRLRARDVRPPRPHDLDADAVKRELPLLITAVIGLFMILSFFVPHHLVSVPADFLQQCAVIVVAFGYVLGGANALRVNLEGIGRRRPDWPYKAVLVAALLV